jgi:hypothetical protein
MSSLENAPPVQLCCEAYELMPALLLGSGKVCDNTDCIFVAENGHEGSCLIYNPHVCKMHQRYYCERCFAAARRYTLVRVPPHYGV